MTAPGAAGAIRAGGDRYRSVQCATQEVLGDSPAMVRELLVAGRQGGWGNQRFKSSTNRTPRQFGRGAPGEKRSTGIELKVIADVGLLGCPMPASRPLIRAVSAARPFSRGADYPSLTLNPIGGGGRAAPRSRDGRHPGTDRGAAAAGAGLGSA
jgi:GTP-binding protein